MSVSELLSFTSIVPALITLMEASDPFAVLIVLLVPITVLITPPTAVDTVPCRIVAFLPYLSAPILVSILLKSCHSYPIFLLQKS